MKQSNLMDGRGDHLGHSEQVERGITALAEKGLVWEPLVAGCRVGPVSCGLRVRHSSFHAGDPVTRWDARLVLLAVVVHGLAFAVFCVSETLKRLGVTRQAEARLQAR